MEVCMQHLSQTNISRHRMKLTITRQLLIQYYNTSHEFSRQHCLTVYGYRILQVKTRATQYQLLCHFTLKTISNQRNERKHHNMCAHHCCLPIYPENRCDTKL